jgi:hypothetical protein
MPVPEKKVDANDREQLRKLNIALTECITTTFLPDFISGKPANI